MPVLEILRDALRNLERHVSFHLLFLGLLRPAVLRLRGTGRPAAGQLADCLS
jgi:hypothetical protein